MVGSEIEGTDVVYPSKKLKTSNLSVVSHPL